MFVVSKEQNLTVVQHQEFKIQRIIILIPDEVEVGLSFILSKLFSSKNL